MSTIIASNISDGTTSVASTYVVNGSAKAWVNFTGTGSVTINDSLNISSLSDIGTGNYRVYYTTSMSNVNYSITIAGASTSAGAAGSGKNIGTYTEYNLVNSAGVSCFTADGSDYEDPTRAFFQVAGDLA